MDYGIGNIKVALEFVFTAIIQGLDIDQNKDGNISFAEVFASITPLAFKLPEVQQAYPWLKKEFKDLDDNEIEQLKDFVNNELELPTRYEEVEEAVKRTVNMLAYNYRYTKFMIDTFRKPVVPTLPTGDDDVINGEI